MVTKTTQPGQKTNEEPRNEPLSFVKLFITDDQIVDQTDSYAQQRIDEAMRTARNNNSSIGSYSKYKLWVPTNREEIQKFLGVIFLQGMVHKPTIRDYWSTDVIYSTPIFSVNMSLNRLENLLAFLHFNDNMNAPPRDDPNRDSLYKIRPLLEYLE